MRDLLVIVLIAVLALGIGYWVMRGRTRLAPEGAAGRNAPEGAAGRNAPEGAAGRNAPEGAAGPLPSVAGRTAPTGGAAGVSGSGVGEAIRLAVLEFEGEPGRVMVMRPEVVIGRHREDDIQVRDVRVSRHHARLVARRDGGFDIHNLTAVRSEPNPMQINGVTREHASLENGDIVSLGGVSFTLWLKAA